MTTPLTGLLTDIDALPEQPGAYLMRGADGEVLYVGKAVDLRARVKQYWAREADGRFHIGFLVPQISTVEVVVTTHEREALLLEDTLIKKYQPRYNVKLKDDKSWLSVRLPVRDPWPRLTLVRRWREDGARHFGPYLNEVNAREVLRLVTRLVPLRTCTDAVFRAHNKRPCIEHDMGRCAAPCAGRVDAAGYKGLVGEAVLLLEGRSREVKRRLELRMTTHAEALDFEEAARCRDRLALLERIAEKQSARVAEDKDVDAFALVREGTLAAVTLLPLREGRLQDPLAWSFSEVVCEDGELLDAVIGQYYEATDGVPGEVLLSHPVPNAEARGQWLADRCGRKVRLAVPQRGEGRRIVHLSLQNAHVRFQAAWSKADRAGQRLNRLAELLRLPKLPRRMECYDNSNTQGTDPVGSMVTFRDAAPWKDGYRIFKIREVEGADDFATMREVLGRRIRRAVAGEEGWELPDLIVIDGGRGQLAQAVAACFDAGIGVYGPDGGPLHGGPAAPLVRIISIAKPGDDEATDKLFEPGRANAISLRPNDPGLHLVQAIRDEAHRFGVHHHRGQRTQRTVRSALDDIPGVGPTLRTRLLKRFGSVRNLAEADEARIAEVQGVGPGRAKLIRDAVASFRS